MTTPKMNRIFTVKASSITTADTLIPWRYSGYGAQAQGFGQPVTSLPSDGLYAWSASLLGSHAFSAVNTSAKLVAATITELELGRISVNPDGSPNSATPNPGDLLRDETLSGKEVRFGPASLYPDSYVSFVASGRNDYFNSDSKYEEFFFIAVDGSITAVGDAFTLQTDTDIVVTVEDQTASAAISEPMEFSGVWGQLIEQGLTQSIASSGSILTTTREQVGTLLIRYDSRLLAGESVVDDLGREWRVTSSRPIRDRRFLEYELSLDVL